ncbi:peptidylprolyl isomerase [bacterium]|nr:peptidylprolyl isomerase [bacterium]
MKKSFIFSIFVLGLALSACQSGKQGEEQVSNDNITTAVIEFENGDVVEFEFLKDKAPNTCENFITLAKKGFYDGLIFHRVIEGFMIQGGCPLGNGTGGPGYTINAEFNDTKHVPGIVSMARSRDPNSAGSQFFICVADCPHLDNNYTAFGRVTKGYDVVEKISKTKVNLQDRPLEPVVMKKVYVK